jgi:histidinol dehydrogenase
MPIRLSSTQADFSQALAKLLAGRASAQPGVTEAVADIIAQVRQGGDAALISLTEQFDRHRMSAETMRVSPQELAHALALVSPELMRSLKLAAQRIRDYSENQLPVNLDYVDAQGVRLGHRWSAVQSVGLYVPGGTAAYPSSVLMNAVPAKVAGVSRLAMVVPCPGGQLNPAVLAAAHVAGVDEIYKIGGAQAVAALAFGTQSVAAVDKIVGPGNAYVAEAKRQVFGVVGIDMIAGPSEILVIADNTANARWLAADLLSQAEHDKDAQSILITDDSTLAAAVEKEIEHMLKTLPRAEIARASWEKHGAIITAENLAQACAIANRIAPEHLELCVAAPEALMDALPHAGAIFLGHHTPEAMGDYLAGPSHVLPTSGTARFSSGLSVFDFLKRTSIAGCSAEAFAALAPYVETLAASEGLEAHRLSVAERRT